jgi:hypothetical protein
MPDAVEICKLRLFLQLVSQVDSAKDLEPLPDIDFNIRAGNTLVGYATEEQFNSAVFGNLVDKDIIDEIKARIADLADCFERFREQQTVYGGNVTTDDKHDIKELLNKLIEELDKYLAVDYRIDLEDKNAFVAWRASHQPFHWFAEFYGVMREGGFDVVIGNPPYVEIRNISNSYSPLGYKTQECGNLYALCSERALNLIKPLAGNFGFILPVAANSTDGYASLKSTFLSAGKCFISSYNDRPGKLFEELEHIRLSIVLVYRGKNGVYTSKYSRWNTVAREHLFPQLQYQVNSHQNHWKGSVPKFGSELESEILIRMHRTATFIRALVCPNQKNIIYYTRKLSYFVQTLGFIPSIVDDNGNIRLPSELKRITFTNHDEAEVVLALLNSNLFYWFLTLFSDVRNLNQREILEFPVACVDANVAAKLSILSQHLMSSFQDTSKVLTMRYANRGTLHIQCIYPKLSKKIIDEIDITYGRAIGMNDDMLDFIINYDIKYRMSGIDDEE